MIKTLLLVGALTFNAPSEPPVENTPTTETIVQKSYVYEDTQGKITITLINETDCSILTEEVGKEPITNSCKYVKEKNVLTIINGDKSLKFEVNEETMTLKAYEADSDTTIIDKVTSLENYIKEQATKIANTELIAGLSIGTAISIAITALGALLRLKFSKKKDLIQEQRNNSFNERLDKAYADNELNKKELLEIQEKLQEYCNNQITEISQVKEECKNILVSVKEALPELKEYQQFNQKLTAVINVLDELKFTKEYISNGTSEKVSEIIEEVR